MRLLRGVGWNEVQRSGRGSGQDAMEQVRIQTDCSGAHRGPCMGFGGAGVAEGGNSRSPLLCSAASTGTVTS